MIKVFPGGSKTGVSSSSTFAQGLLFLAGALGLRLSGPLGENPWLSVAGFFLCLAAMGWFWNSTGSPRGRVHPGDSPNAETRNASPPTTNGTSGKSSPNEQNAATPLNPKRPWPTGVFTLILIAVAGRLLFFGYPVSDDYNRYAWEGRMQTLGHNPYALAPEVPSLEHLRDATWKGINHPELPSIYPPGALMLFKVAAPFYPSPEPFRLLLLLSESISLIVLGRLLILKNLPVKWLVLYAWNPFVLVFVMGEAHLDGIMGCLLLLCLYAWSKGRPGWAHFSLGLAVMVKLIPLIFLPALLNKKSLKFLPVFGLPFLLYIPYLAPGVHPFATLETFSSGMTFNAPWHYFWTRLLEVDIGTWSLLLLGFLGGLHLLLEPRLEKNFLFLALLFLMLAPTVHPWYLVLALPFLALSPIRSLLVLCVTHFIFLLPQYTHNVETGIWREYSWSKWLIWIPFYLCLWVDAKWPVRPHRKYRSTKQTGLSVVIPVYNESAQIALRLGELQQSLKDIPHEILVVDGGSNDDTESQAGAFPVTWLSSPQKGRGYQLSEGLHRARFAYTLFQHVDTRLPPEGYRHLYDMAKKTPAFAAGWHAMQFDALAPPHLKIIRFLNNFRGGFLGIAFGDQLQFVHTDTALKENMLEPMPLMEDIALSLAVKQNGDYGMLPTPITVSSRKWRKKSFSANSLLVTRLVLQFLFLKRWGTFNPQSAYFQSKYYGAPPS